MHEGLSDLISNAGLGSEAGSGGVSGTNSSSDISSVIQEATDKIQQLQTVTQSNIDSITANTEALASGDESKSSSAGESFLSTASSEAGSLLSGGGLLSGLFGGGGLIGDEISGLSSLFGGGSTQPDFTQYQAPAKQNIELATGGGATGDAVDDQNGQARVAPISELGLSGVQPLDSPTSGTLGAGGNAGTGTSSAQQVTVNIQAMDSQSFMDRSSDIAQAVRSAMLNMSSINDVISDL